MSAVEPGTVTVTGAQREPHRALVHITKRDGDAWRGWCGIVIRRPVPMGADAARDQISRMCDVCVLLESARL